MDHNGQVQGEIDLSAFDEARAKYPPELLLPFAGKYVAWNPDGSRILASAETPEDLDRHLDDLGIRYGQVVYDFIGDGTPLYY